jgi:hypothetical protein
MPNRIRKTKPRRGCFSGYLRQRHLDHLLFGEAASLDLPDKALSDVAVIVGRLRLRGRPPLVAQSISNALQSIKTDSCFSSAVGRPLGPPATTYGSIQIRRRDLRDLRAIWRSLCTQTLALAQCPSQDRLAGVGLHPKIVPKWLWSKKSSYVHTTVTWAIVFAHKPPHENNKINTRL